MMFWGFFLTLYGKIETSRYLMGCNIYTYIIHNFLQSYPGFDKTRVLKIE